MAGFSFTEFMAEGGWGMWPILVVGLMALAAAGRFGVNPARPWLRFAALLWLTLLAAVAHATVTDLAAVFHHFEGLSPGPDSRTVAVFFTGLKECTRPAALGGVFLTVVPLLAAVGVYRDPGR